MANFCPFRSTADKEVECSENCALYTIETSEDDNEEACAFYLLTQRLKEIRNLQTKF